MINYKLSNYAYLQIFIYNSSGGLSSSFQLVLPTKALNLSLVGNLSEHKIELGSSVLYVHSYWLVTENYYYITYW